MFTDEFSERSHRLEWTRYWKLATSNKNKCVVNYWSSICRQCILFLFQFLRSWFYVTLRRFSVFKIWVTLLVSVFQCTEDQVVSTMPSLLPANTFCSKLREECEKQHNLLITGMGAKPQKTTVYDLHLQSGGKERSILGFWPLRLWVLCIIYNESWILLTPVTCASLAEKCLGKCEKLLLIL